MSTICPLQAVVTDDNIRIWNFTKFLIDRQGNVIARFEPTEDMDDVRRAVEKEMGQYA